MLSLISRIANLLIGFGILVVGSSFLSTLLGVRAVREELPTMAIGVVMSSYFLGFFIGTLRIPGLIRRIGHIRVYATLAATAAIVAAVHGLIVDPLIWAILRFATGWSLSGLYMTIESWLSSEAANTQRGKVLAVYTIVTLLANASGQYLLLTGDPESSMPYTLAAILFALGLIPVTLTRLQEPRAVAVPRLDLRRLHGVSPLAVVGALASGLANSAFWGMGPAFAERSGFGAAGVAVFMSATILGGALLQWPIGHLSDRLDRRSVLVGVCFAASAAAIGASFSRGSAVIPFAVLYGGGAFTLYALSLAHASDHAGPEETLETTRGLLLLYGVGAVFGPTAAGALMAAVGLWGLFLHFAVVQAVVGVYGLVRLRRRRPVAAQEEFVPLVRTSPAALEMHPSIPRPTSASSSQRSHRTT